VLHEDLGFLDKFLDRQVSAPHGMMWIGPAGTVTSLHHDLTNNFIAQLVGRKRVKLLPSSEVGKVYNHRHVFSEIPDLEDPALDLLRHPRLTEVRIYDIMLEPGEILFMPFGWWHQVKSLDFSVTITYTNFVWRNDAHVTYPG
jgi:ribosomal protein L16 Arg81 hydroxylase